MASPVSHCRGHILRCCCLAVLVVGFLTSEDWRLRAQGNTVPSIGGDWDLKIAGQKLKLKITQKGGDISGAANFAKGGPVAFDVSGSIDGKGQLTIKLFWAQAAAAADVKPEAWPAAVKKRGEDSKHPGLLPIENTIELKYKEDTSAVVEELEGKLSVPKLKVKLKKETGAFEEVESITDQALEAQITRGYAARCAAEMGTIPQFSCLDGEILKVTFSDVEKTAPVPACDNPIQLPLDGDGQCVPGSRLVRLPQNSDHPAVRTVAICRKYKGSLAPEVFNDIAMVSHNEATGNTCFFQSPVGGKTYDGRKIPSPTDEDHASEVWGARKADTKRGAFGPAGVRCNACHSAGPFLWSPYVGQVVDIDQARKTWDPEGKYHSNFANMFGQTSKLLTPAGNDCRECHRLGDGTSCRVFAKEYVEKKHKNGTKDKFWMPFDYAGDLRKDYGSGIDQLARCCDDPSLAECKTRDATPENTGRNR